VLKSSDPNVAAGFSISIKWFDSKFPLLISEQAVMLSRKMKIQKNDCHEHGRSQTQTFTRTGADFVHASCCRQVNALEKVQNYTAAELDRVRIMCINVA
jgi:hypothetical protein